MTLSPREAERNMARITKLIRSDAPLTEDEANEQMAVAMETLGGVLIGIWRELRRERSDARSTPS